MLRFQQIVLPCEDNYLRARTQDRYAYRVGRFDPLSSSIEHNLTRVLENELNLFRKLGALKGDLERKYDWSTYAGFRSLDIDNNGQIEPNNI